MVTLYQNSRLEKPGEAMAGQAASYSGYQEPDTKVPPKAAPVLKQISVNGVEVPEADILAEAQNHPASSPGEALIAAARALVVRELLLQEAARLDIASPQEQAGAQAESGEEALVRELIEREVAVPLAGEEECRRFYENNPERFCSETIHEARHILLAASAQDKSRREQARGIAKDLIVRLKQERGAFPALASAHSDCPSREQGGNLGQLTRGSTVREFEQALERMREGELLGMPVESRFGFHVIELVRKIPGKQIPFENVKETISGWLEAASWSKAVAQYISVLAGAADIKGIDLEAAQSPLVQ